MIDFASCIVLPSGTATLTAMIKGFAIVTAMILAPGHWFARRRGGVDQRFGGWSTRNGPLEAFH